MKMKELLFESTLVQALVSLILIGVLGYMEIAQIPVSDWFQGVVFLVVGFWFGSKIPYQKAKTEKAKQQMRFPEGF